MELPGSNKKREISKDREGKKKVESRIQQETAHVTFSVTVQ